jgi:histidinol phosphatase-like enzyme (inositol monophosphatase family)
MDKQLQADLTSTAAALADAARVETLRYFRRPDVAAENKDSAGFDPVTIADRGAEAAMRRILAERRPMDGILGEEHGAQAGTSGWTWVLDPIDGTRGYISGTPTWGVLIAVGRDAGPEFGVIDQPFIKERFSGGFGVADYAGPHGTGTLTTAQTPDLAGATIFTTFPEVGNDQDRRAFHHLAAACQLTRYGMDCYAYALLAAGQVDLVVEAGLNAYDIQAPIAVIQAAGGVVTDWNGGPAHHGGRALAAANPALHAQAMARLQEALK